MGSQRVGHDLATKTTTTKCLHLVKKKKLILNTEIKAIQKTIIFFFSPSDMLDVIFHEVSCGLIHELLVAIDK